MAMWVEHTATVEATVMRLVTCEECEHEFVYELTVSGTGEANSAVIFHGKAPERAEKQAREALKSSLKYSCRALPCPNCAHYQQHMISEAKSEKSGNLIGFGIAIGVVAIIGGVILLASDMKGLGIATLALGVLVGGGMAGVGAYIHSTFDPNAVPEEERFEKAAEHTILRADYERLFLDTAAKEFAKICKKLDQGKDTKQKVTSQFFADLDQIYDERTLKAELPNGEQVKIPLRRKMKTGEKFSYEHDYKGHTIRFEYQLLVYTETKERK